MEIAIPSIAAWYLTCYNLSSSFPILSPPQNHEETTPIESEDVQMAQSAPESSDAPQFEEVTKEEQMEKLKTYEDRMDDLLHLNDMKIMTTMLEHLNKGIEKILISIHANYAFMFDVIKNLDRDKEITISLMDKWIPRDQMLRDMVVASYHDVNKPLKILLTLIFLTNTTGSQGLIVIESLEVKIRELGKKFDDYNFGILLEILNEKGEAKSLQEWNDQVAQAITS